MTDLQGKDVEFFGKITASMTHEFKNVLAIIKESAGLMEDITQIAPLSDSRHQEKLDNALKTIKNQLNRGMELSTVFNRFAHTPDKSVAEINLHHLAGQVVTLSERFARLKHITLTVAPEGESDTSLAVTGSPVWLQMAVYLAIECGLKILPAESAITLTSEIHDGKKSIRLDFAPGQADAADAGELAGTVDELPGWAELSQLMQTVDGAAGWLDLAPGIRLTFE